MNHEYGTIVAAGTLRLERELPGPIERVWAYLTEPEKRRTWLAGGEMELRVGGRVELNFVFADLTQPGEVIPERYREMGDCHQKLGQVTQCEPPARLAFSWNHDDAAASEVKFELTPVGDKVRMVLTHERLPDRDTLLSVSGGWHTHVDRLIERLEGVPPQPFWAAHLAKREEYDRRIPQD